MGTEQGMFNKKTAASALVGVLMTSPSVLAGSFSTSTDTGADALDFIESDRRTRRENRLDEKEQAVLDTTREIEARIRYPLAEGMRLPTAFEGDEVIYDQETGEFLARGNVKVTQLDNRQFSSEEIRGNAIRQDVYVDDVGQIIQLSPATPRVNLRGWKIKYNYGTGIGTMEEAKGRIGSNYITGKKFEVYPDKIIILEGTITKCSAAKPDYHTSAQRIEIYPNDKMYMYDCDFWIGKVLVSHRDRYIADIRPGADRSAEFPRIRYNSEDGLVVSQKRAYAITDDLTFIPMFRLTTRVGDKSNVELHWKPGKLGTFRLQYGHYQDGDDRWLKRYPSLRYDFTHRIGRAPLSFHAAAEHGKWRNARYGSMHTKWVAGLTHDPIYFGDSLWLNLSGDYSVTQESYDDSTVRGWSGSASLIKRCNDDFYVFTKYVYSQSSAEKVLFDYEAENYARALYSGLSYQLTPLDRVVVSTAYDLEANGLKDMDYYWFHDLHCVQVISRYRAKREQFSLRMDFTPW